jgi:hypothetical protein
MNMFVGAVASFANAIDEQQAIAAWAGEVGKAAGLNNEPEKQVNGESPRGEVAQPAPSAYLPNGPEGEEKGTPTVVEKFLHAPPGPSRGVSGESRENIQLRSTQATFAQNLGIPLEQVQQGAVSKGDIAFESRQLMAKIRNNIIQLQRSLASQPLLPAAQKSKIINEIQVQQRGLRIFEQQKGKVLDKAREGGRSITVGERAIVVNVNGAGDPMKTGMAVKSAIVGNAKEIANSFNDGISH